METKEIRSFDFDINASESEERGKYIEGRAIVYNQRTNLGWYDEIIAADALKDTDLRDVRLLVNHNTDMIPLARSRNNNANSTMQLTVDEEGLLIRANLDTENNNDAKALYSAVERRDLDGMSFMFVVDKDAWDDLESDHPTRTITGIKRVLEVSGVTFPAYSATSLQARGLADALDSAKASLESAKAEAREIERKKQRIRILTEVQK
ncbi:MAG: HK97 family phage prohead protease [Clostridiales bacterium]|nr:HK97 family phage prohead protease [Clostridiales bacterium]